MQMDYNFYTYIKDGRIFPCGCLFVYKMWIT